MLETEYALGDYLQDNRVIKVNSEQRKRMVILLEELVRKRRYRRETLFLAVSLADRYLVTLTVSERPAPCLVNLAVTCLLLAAKLNQPLRPKFDLMNRLLQQDYDVTVKTEDFLALEMDILKVLKFDLQFVSPLPFLDRYQRVFGLDLEEADSASRKVGALARDFCLFMQREAHFLQFRPSQQAAAALVLAVKTHHFFDHAPPKWHYSQATSIESDFALRMWTPEIEAMTTLSVRDDIKPVYRLLESTVRYTSIAANAT